MDGIVGKLKCLGVYLVILIVMVQVLQTSKKWP